MTKEMITSTEAFLSFSLIEFCKLQHLFLIKILSTQNAEISQVHELLHTGTILLSSFLVLITKIFTSLWNAI